MGHNLLTMTATTKQIYALIKFSSESEDYYTPNRCWEPATKKGPTVGPHIASIGAKKKIALRCIA